MSDHSASVQVAVRVRPLNERELKHNTLPVVTASSEKKEVTLIRTGATNRQQRQTYSFDGVFSDYSTQRDVFEKVRPLVDDVLSGYEGTVRASARCRPRRSSRPLRLLTREATAPERNDRGPCAHATALPTLRVRRVTFATHRLACDRSLPTGRLALARRTQWRATCRARMARA